MPHLPSRLTPAGRPTLAGRLTLAGRAALGLSLASLLVAGCDAPASELVHTQGGSLAPLGVTEVAYADNTTPRYLAGRVAMAPMGSAPAAAAVQLLVRGALAPSFRLAPETDFTVISDATDKDGRRFVKLQQRHAGLDVVGREVVLGLSADGALERLHGQLHPELRLADDKKLDGAAAMGAALATLGTGRLLDAPTLAIYVPPGGAPRLVYRARAEYHGAEGRTFAELFASASDGTLVARHPRVYTALDRSIYDLKKVCLKDGSELPGTKLMDEGGTTMDASGTRAYDNTGKVYWFYKHMFGRDSYDDKGAKLVSSVHGTFDTGMGCSGENAAWIPDMFNQMVYGDGDAFGGLLTLKDLTLGFDVAAHELTHAVTSMTSNLTYMNEPGALNEAMSDILGAGCEAWSKSGGGAMGNPASITADASTWKIGEDVIGLLFATIGALRLMNDPTKDGASKDYYPERETGMIDNGGVHFNSGIGNLAFYLMAQGGGHPRSKTDVKVDKPLGIEKALRIFYYANVRLLTSTSNFEDARYATAAAAENLYGRCSQEWLTVHKAWDTVAVPGIWSLCSRPPGRF
ncbi:MAG: M4 family metallopeptidase [Polyangia bacterium]